MNEGENLIIMKKNIQLLKLIGLHVAFDNNIVVKQSKIRVYLFACIIASIFIFQLWTVSNKSTVLEATNALAMASSTFCFLGKYVLMYHHRIAFWNLMKSLQHEYKQSKYFVSKNFTPSLPELHTDGIIYGMNYTSREFHLLKWHSLELIQK